jgi:Protein of unknwon function (DUF3310)
MQECFIHKKLFHTFCPDCMLVKNTVYGAGPSDCYYPPGAKQPDMVNSPDHYTQGNIECIDAIAEVVKHLNGIEAMCTGNAIKYLWRWRHKNGVEDLKKAQWYIQRMIDGFDAN